MRAYINNFKELELMVTPSKSLPPYFQKLRIYKRNIQSHRKSTVDGYFMHMLPCGGAFPAQYLVHNGPVIFAYLETETYRH